MLCPVMDCWERGERLKRSGVARGASLLAIAESNDKIGRLLSYREHFKILRQVAKNYIDLEGYFTPRCIFDLTWVNLFEVFEKSI